MRRWVLRCNCYFSIVLLAGLFVGSNHGNEIRDHFCAQKVMSLHYSRRSRIYQSLDLGKRRLRIQASRRSKTALDFWPGSQEQ